MDLADFEDAVCVASALEACCDLIVTRNPQHFRGAVLATVLPEALLAAMAQQPDDPPTRLYPARTGRRSLA
jgi:hypothetical protein